MRESIRFCLAFGILCLACALVAIGGVFWTINPAMAQECPSYSDVKKAIADNYGEAPAGSGILEAGNAVLMIFASPKGDTWTAAVLRADGTACIVFHGSDWIDPIPPQFSMKDRRPA